MILARIQKLSVGIPENLAEILEEEIIFGRLKSKERLTEEMVAERYGVSRSPVREALRLLERDGLVTREARRGIWVSPMSQKDFDEIYMCRIPLEGLVAQQAAEAKAQLRNLDAIMKKHKIRGFCDVLMTSDAAEGVSCMVQVGHTSRGATVSRISDLWIGWPPPQHGGSAVAAEVEQRARVERRPPVRLPNSSHNSR